MQYLYLIKLTKKDSDKEVDERGYWAYVSLFPPPGSKML